MRMILSIYILLFSQVVLAPSPGMVPLEYFPPVNPFERLIEAVVSVESSGDQWALNAKEQACGAFQIRPVRMDDYNRRTGSHYMTWDAFDPEIARKVFLYYCSTYGPYQIETIAKRWNGMGELTEEYWRKVLNEIRTKEITGKE